MAVDLQANNTKLNLTLDFRLVSLLLVLVIAVMCVIWKPWSGNNTGSRTVEIKGEATLRATPDEYVFYPSYEVRGANKQAALDELTKKSEEIVGKLKELGVAEKAIKTNTSGYDYTIYGNTVAYTLQLTITLSNEKLTQKVQDYLITTNPTGAVSPQYDFSDAKRKQLENQARDEATKEARAKAVQMGKNLGFKVGKVKAVSDDAGFGGPITYDLRAVAPVAEDKATSSLGIHAGENELSYSVTVVYFIK